MDTKDLIEAMVRYRAKENISQKELAKRCNLSLQTINSIETGQQEPLPRTKAKIEIVIKED